MQPSEFGKRNPSTSLQQSPTKYKKPRGDKSEGIQMFPSVSERSNPPHPDDGETDQSPDTTIHAQRKKEIFVGGITKDTTVKELSWAFSYFGRVNHVRIMTYADGTSRGFAFVKYKHVRSAEAAVKTGFLKVGNITTEIRSGLTANGSKSYKNLMMTRKVFIGGISSKLQHSDILNYLSQYGEVHDFMKIQHSTAGIPANYGFAIFADKEGADRFLEQKGGHIIKGFCLKTGPAADYKKSKLDELSDETVHLHDPKSASQRKSKFATTKDQHRVSTESSSEGSSSVVRQRWEPLDHPEDNLVFNMRVGHGSSATSKYLTQPKKPHPSKLRLFL